MLGFGRTFQATGGVHFTLGAEAGAFMIAALAGSILELPIDGCPGGSVEPISTGAIGKSPTPDDGSADSAADDVSDAAGASEWKIAKSLAPTSDAAKMTTGVRRDRATSLADVSFMMLEATLEQFSLQG